MTNQNNSQSKLASLRAQAPPAIGYSTVQPEVRCDVSSHLKPYVDADYYPVSIVGRKPNPDSNRWDPRNPYGYSPEAISSLVELIRPKLEETLAARADKAEDGSARVVVIARPDDCSLGMAALTAVATIQDAVARAGIADWRIAGIPITSHITGPRRPASTLQADLLEAIMEGGPARNIQAWQAAFDREWDDTTGSADFVALDVALARAVDAKGFTYGVSDGRAPAKWLKALMQDCRETGVRPANRFENLHVEYTSQLDPNRLLAQTTGSFNQTRTAEGILATLETSAPHPDNNREGDHRLEDGGEIEPRTTQIEGVNVTVTKKDQ